MRVQRGASAATVKTREVTTASRVPVRHDPGRTLSLGGSSGHPRSNSQTSAHDLLLWSRRCGIGVLGLVVAGREVACPKCRSWGCESAALESESLPRCPPGPVAMPFRGVAGRRACGRRRCWTGVVSARIAIHRGLAGRVLRRSSARLGGLAELDDGHDVQAPVDAPVPGAGQSVAVAGRRRTRRWVRCRSRTRSGPCRGSGGCLRCRPSSRAAPEGPIPVQLHQGRAAVGDQCGQFLVRRS